MKQNKCQVLKKSIYQENFFKKKFKKPSLDAVFFLDLSVTLKQQASQLILENGGTITLFPNKVRKKTKLLFDHLEVFYFKSANISL